MYSIGNEIPETGNKFDTQWGKKLADKLRSLDDSRYVTNSLNLMLSIMDRLGEMKEQMAAQAEAKANAKDTEGKDLRENSEINSMMSSMGDMMNSREWDFMRRIRIRRHIAET